MMLIGGKGITLLDPFSRLQCGCTRRGLINATKFNHTTTGALNLDPGDAISFTLECHLWIVGMRRSCGGCGKCGRRGVAQGLETLCDLGIAQNRDPEIGALLGIAGRGAERHEFVLAGIVHVRVHFGSETFKSTLTRRLDSSLGCFPARGTVSA